jgi:hypothetical protein
MDPGPDFLQSYLRNADLLHDLLVLYEEVGKEFVSSPEVSDLIVRVWTARDSEGKLFMDADYPRRGRGCPIASFLHRVMEFEEGREGLLQQLLSVRASFTHDFAKATVERVHRTRDAAYAGADPTQRWQSSTAISIAPSLDSTTSTNSALPLT